MRRVLSVAVFLGSVPAFAGPDPKLVDAIHKVKASEFPSANTLEIVADQSVVYQPDGQFTTTFHQVQLVLTQAGIAQAASQSLPYAKDAETMEVITAQVIKADGTAVPVAAKDIQDTELTGNMNIYDPNGRA
ncbi:MAG TPA: DUF3857 domain-containing protein, partial [Kofleriaceae bacterium]|nr:DUF3857 domain-containing protein [Kofleriaceae bacterium]